MKLIMIKYAELTTKKDNRNYFINTLVKNIESALFEFDPIIERDYFRMFVKVDESVLDECVLRLTKVFGIHEVTIASFIEDKSIDSICSEAKNLICSGVSFKVETNRSDKTYQINSMDVSRTVGGYLLKNVSNLKVDVHSPEVYLNIEIRKEGVYLYKNGLKGSGGYPTGTLGKAILMLSGGIDSVVAGYLTMKRGVKLDFLYFESLPHTSLEARKKVVELSSVLKKYGNDGKLYVVPFTKIQESIYRNLDNQYMITIMRRMMYRIAEKFAKKNKSLAIVNGESIGQVASQTLTSIRVVNDVTISILPYEDCCTIFVPTHPVINPNLEHVYSEEKKFDFSLIDEAVDSIFSVDLEKDEKDDYL